MTPFVSPPFQNDGYRHSKVKIASDSNDCILQELYNEEIYVVRLRLNDNIYSALD